MIYGLYTMYDSVAALYQQPFTAVNDEVAARSFKANFANSSSVLALNPSDFRLVKIGSMDMSTGVITVIPEEVILTGAAAVAERA